MPLALNFAIYVIIRVRGISDIHSYICKNLRTILTCVELYIKIK